MVYLLAAGLFNGKSLDHDAVALFLCLGAHRTGAASRAI
jgi:hypothetical protein